MKIDLTKLKRKYWFEDKDGNIVEKDDPRAAVYYHCFPLTLYEELDSYGYHHKNKFVRFLCKDYSISQWINKNRQKTFKPMCTFHTTYKAGQDCIIAMVNSGDYTLEEAIWIYAKSCERCMNVLEHKYLNGQDGYAEHSEEWKKCGTVCDFCRDEEEMDGGKPDGEY